MLLMLKVATFSEYPFHGSAVTVKIALANGSMSKPMCVL